MCEHLNDWPVALDELGGLVAGGATRFRESVVEGLASAPEAFRGLLAGRNFGKQFVRADLGSVGDLPGQIDA